MNPFLQFRFYCCCLLLLGMQALQAQSIYLVDSARPLSNAPVAVTTVNAAAWASATSNLQAAINAAAGSGGQVWVAKGTYQAGAGTSFSMKSNVKVYGGFVNTATTLSQRNFITNPTILKGNGSSVVRNDAVTNSALLDGFTITGGNNPIGGGMVNSSSSLTLTNCTFTNNTSSYGGGMYNFLFSSPTLTNCTFIANSGSSYGGGMYNSVSSPTLTNCTFIANSGSSSGGGMYNNSSSPTLTNCTFTGNSSFSGGGMENISASPTLTNCTFSGNSSSSGGGMENIASSFPTLTNCTFSGNSSSFSGGGIYNSSSSPTLTNCILWGNTTTGLASSIYNNPNSSPTVTYSLVQGSYPGSGNINADPLFVNASDPDGADNLFGTADDGLRLLPGSPAINVGNNDSIPAGIISDITGAARIQNGIVDMGAYESPYSSYSITTTVAVTSVCAGISLAVSYTAVGNYATGNVFTAQLSNAAGSFNSPVVIGSVTATTSGNITTTIPAGTSSGSGYRVRVVSSGPAITGTDNGTNLTINALPPKPTIIASGPTTFCAGDSVRLSISDTGNSWTRKMDFGGTATAYSVGFSIAGKGYIGTGTAARDNKKDFWEYDPITNSWTQKADFGGTARYGATGFSIGSKGYIGTGNDGFSRSDFWQYDPATNVWIQKANFGGMARVYATGFSIGSKGYIGTGNDGNERKDFWEYDPATDSWTRKTDFGGIARSYATGFSIGGKGYIGTGGDASISNFKKDFWEYDPATNMWTQKADFGGIARIGATSFSIGDKGYIGTGANISLTKDFWEYNPAINTWTQKADFSGGERYVATGFSIGSRAYIGTGITYSGLSKDFWEYAPGYIYSWSPGGQTTPSISVTQGGNYTLTATTVAGCSATSDPLLVAPVIAPQVDISVSGPTTFCAGDSVILSAPAGPAFYLWSNGATTRSIIVKQSGTYSVIVKTSGGCTSPPSNPITVIVKPLPAKPIITASGPTTFCAGDSVMLSRPLSNTWVQIADFGGTARHFTAGFSIGSKGYIGTGNDGNVKKDFWEYDPAANTWTQKANFGGTSRYGATGFSIGSKGYIGTGHDTSGYRKDFWEYDPATNAWIQRADFGGIERDVATGFNIGNKGYIGTGINGSSYKKDFWEYDPATNAWIQKADFGGTARYGAAGFSIGTRGYIGTGYSDGILKKDFWEYNPAANTWVQKADFGGIARYSAASFSIGNKGYIGTGYGSGYTKDFWEYDPATNAWIQKADFGGAARYATTSFSIGSKGYIGTGYAGANKKDFWEYTPGDSYSYKWAPGGQTTPSIPVTQSGTYALTITNASSCSATSDPIIVTVNPLPAKPVITASGPTTFCAGDSVRLSAPTGMASYLWSSGANTQSITATQGGIYSVRVTNSNNSCGATSDATLVTVNAAPAKPAVTASGPTTLCAGSSVNLSATDTGNTWIQKADFGGTARYLAASFSIGSKGYIGTGSDNNNLRKDFWEYNTATNVWTQKADFGGTARIGALGFSIGSKGYIGTGGDNVIGPTKDFWEYDPTTNVWAQKADFAGIARYYATGFSIGSKGYIGTGFSDNGYRKDFWEYDPTTNTWVQKADFGGTARFSAVSFIIGSRGYVGTGDAGNPAKDFWEYDPANNTWAQKADLGGGLAGIGAVGFSIGSKGYIGTGNEGIIGKNFWEYNPATNNWTRRADFGGTERGSATGFSIGSKGYIGTGGYDNNSKKDFWEYNPSYTYSWSPGGQTTPSITVTQSGTYTLTATNASGCSSTSDPIIVTVNLLPAKPNISTIGPITFCAGDSVRLSAPAGFAAYQWSNGATTQSITVMQNGTYSVRVTNGNGCVSPSSDTTTITVNLLPAKPAITVSGLLLFNAGDSAILTAPAGFARYQWSNGDTTRSIIVKTAGSYTVAVTNSNGCTSPASDPVVISLYASPVIFVTTTGAGNKSGLNWANAIANSQIQSKMVSAVSGSQFWVKTGTYQPSDFPNGCSNCNNDRDKAFLLKNGVSLYGGFAGTESLLSQRNVAANATILNASGNYHVVISIGNDTTARLDGFTVTGGNANGYGERYIGGQTIGQSNGAGIFNAASSPAIANCIMTANSSSSSGAGMYNGASSPVVSYCTFSFNSSSYDGGGMLNRNASPVISYSKFISNTAASMGGGISNTYSSLSVTNSSFSNNSSYAGGGIANYSSAATITNTAFSANNSNYGGGVYNIYSSAVAITNAVLTGNTASQGGAVYNNSSAPTITNSTFFTTNASGSWSIYNSNSDPVVINSIIWSNGGAGISNQSSSPNIRYSLIKGGYSGTANLDADPLFVNITDPDGADDVFGTADDGLALQACSPGINSGDNAANSQLTDIAGRPRIYNNTIIDRGAYEYQAAAAMFGLAVNGDAGTFLTSSGSTTPLILDCRAIGQLLSTGASPVNGLLTAKAWVDATQTIILPNGQTFIRRHYEITPAANATTTTARITLYATQQEFDDFNTISATDIPSGPMDMAGKGNLRITKYSGQSSNGSGTPGSYPQPATVINPDDNDIVWNSSLNRWEITIPVTGFSGFFIGNGDIILPVTLLSFTGKALPGNEAALNWRTTSEVNTSYFELQRSTDGRMFTVITQLAAKGNSQSITDYGYTDKVLTAGLYYYRLRMVDKDGRESYSGTVTVSFKGEHLLTLYPVPAKKEIWLNGTGASWIGKTALLLDVQGRILQSVRIAQWPQRIEVTALAAGTYLIKVEGEKTVSFVKE